MKLSTTLISAAVAFLPYPAAAKDWNQVVIAVEGAFPPFNYMEAGKPAGFDIDIANAVCAEQKLTCTFVVQDWDGIIPGLIAGKYDAIFSSMTITDARKKVVDFTEAYWNTGFHFMAGKNSEIASIAPDALAKMSVGTQGSTAQALFLEEKYPNIDLKLYQSTDDANNDLVSGRLDLVFSDTVLLDYWIHKSTEGSCCKLVGEELHDPSIGGKGVAVRKSDSDLRDKLNQGIEAIVANGTYSRINDKYFSISIR